MHCVRAAAAATGSSAAVPADVTNQLEMSYAGAQAVAAEYPQYATQIAAAAREAFLAGDQSAYIAGIIAVLVGAALVFLVYPRHDEEQRLLAEYHAEDEPARPAASPAGPAASAA